jgi:predicted aspartyl protease
VISGTVTSSREAIVWLRVYGVRSEIDVGFVVDTGFKGVLVLPESVVREIGLDG